MLKAKRSWIYDQRPLGERRPDDDLTERVAELEAENVVCVIFSA